MSDFCQQCSIEIFGEDHQDLANLGPPLGSGLGYMVICEGCGVTFVDQEGRCISPDCDYRHGKVPECPHVSAYSQENSAGELFLICLGCGTVLRQLPNEKSST